MLQNIEIIKNEYAVLVYNFMAKTFRSGLYKKMVPNAFSVCFVFFFLFLFNLLKVMIC